MGEGTNKAAWDPRKPVVEPRRGRREKTVPAGIILGFTPPDLKLILEYLGVSKVSYRKVDFWKLWTCQLEGHNVGVAGPALGAPAAVLLLERLVVLGARSVVGVGSCGSLQPWLPVGSVVLPDSALVEEGTTPHYLAPHVRTRPHQELLRVLAENLETQGLKPQVGRIWTTDAVFRETREKVILYQREGVLAVDMESSALMSVASFRGVPFASVLVVSDELGTLKWHRGFNTKEFCETLGRAARVVASCLGRWEGNKLDAKQDVESH